MSVTIDFDLAQVGREADALSATLALEPGSGFVVQALPPPQTRPAEFVVSAKQFLAAVKQCSPFADPRSSTPILTHVKIESRGTGELLISATDLRASLTVALAADVRHAGAVCLPAKALAGLLKGTTDELHIVVGTNFIVKITCGASARRFEMPGMPGDNFPTLPMSDGSGDFVPRETLARLIARTSFAMSTDETRPHLASALLECDGTTLSMVTTDGHRLVKASEPFKGTAIMPAMRESRMPCASDASILIERASVLALGRVLKDNAKDRAAEFVKVGAHGQHAFARVGSATLVMRILDAAFPSYQQIIPQGADRTVRIMRAELLSAVREASLVSSDRSSGVKLAFVGGGLTVTSENPDVGSVVIQVPCDRRGSELTIGFNARYLAEMLTAFESKVCGEITLELCGELDPILVRSPPAFAPTTEGDALCVIMPMRI